MKRAPQTTTSTTAPQTTTPISSDRPAKSLAQDRYGLKSSFIPRLVHLALEWPTEDGLVLGLFGSWGIGKTSILNMFRDHVEQNRAQYKSVRIASFNPWFYEDTGALVTSFFATIAEELKTGDGKFLKVAEKGFKGMGAFLTAASKGITISGINVDIDKIGESLKSSGELSDSLAGLAALADGGEKKFDQHRAEVEKALKRLGAKNGRVVVLIDDVDRLSKAELLTMLRLIRTVADLPYMTLVVAMDDERVRDVLEKAVSEGYGQGFLDKIIQAPMHVPLPERAAMINELSEQLKTTLERMEIPLPPELTPNHHYQPHELDILSRLIRTPRDLARYINGFRMLLLAGNDPDIHPTDAALIEALRIFHPDAYNRIRRQKKFLTDSGLFILDPTDKEQGRRIRSAELDFLVRGGTPSLSPKTEESIRGLLEALFGDLADPSAIRARKGDAEHRRIRSPEFFDNYFRYAPPIGTITRREIRKILDDILHHAEAAREDGIAGSISVAFQNRDDDAKDQLVSEIGYGISSIRLDFLKFIGRGILKARKQLPQEIVLNLLESAITAVTNPNQMHDTQTMNAARESCFEILRSALTEQLPVDHFLKLFNKLRRTPWLSEEQFGELAGTLLKRVEHDLQAGTLFQDKARVTEQMSRVFKPAIELCATLGEPSPMPQEVLQNRLTEFINSHPEVLPQVLESFGGDTDQGPVLFLPGVISEEGMSAHLRAYIGDYKRLLPSYEKFKGGQLNVGPYRRLLDDFGTLITKT